MDEKKIDFSSVDPARDAVRWERVVKSVAARAVEAKTYGRGGTVTNQLLAWARPALAIAAALALVIWAGAYLSDSLRSTPAVEPRVEPAFVLARWEAEGSPPAPIEILKILGDRNGTD